ncbi:MAG: hypothetical protein H6684_08945 [Deltaproteobacteria bacterium]|nr:hypothetical protein [Deltaproteobacteria bacterium]MCB9479607.1 hypothetical protein [Deltaproteobacteria bacterium]MCB9488843.1 hypothetical protein [Deltaproteobacteria bacterium]
MNRRWLALIVAAVLALAGVFACGSAEEEVSCEGETKAGIGLSIEECLERFSVENGYDFEPISGSALGVDLTYDYQAPENAAVACEEDEGANCDPETFMTADAALCVADYHGLKKGECGWTATMRYRNSLDAVAWMVSNVTIFERGDRGGRELVIQATTGELLEENTWGEE